MKILFVGNMNDIHTPKWAEYFKERYEVKLFHAERFSLRNIIMLNKCIREFKPDILHAHYAGAWGLMGALMGFHPFVVTIHGSEVLLTKGLKKWLVQWVLKKADFITTDGWHIEDKIKKEWGIPHGKVRHVNFGVDVEKFIPRIGNLFRIIYRSGPDKLYDLDTMTRAIKIVKKYHDPLFQEIKGIDPSKIPYFLGGSTIYVSTALSDAGLSSTTAEAMACGLPVVVTNVGDNQTWIDPSFTFEPGDYKHLADLIMELLRDPELRASQCDMNRDIIVKSNNYAIEMAKMEQIYKEVCNG